MLTTRYFLAAIMLLGPWFSWAQSDNVLEQLEKIRQHYHVLNADLSVYESFQLGDSIHAYFKHYEPEKIVVTRGEATFEFYFSTSDDTHPLELLFAYVVKGDRQHRYYFDTYTNDHFTDRPLSILIRYVNPEGQLESTESAEFREAGLRIAHQAWQTYQTLYTYTFLEGNTLLAWETNRDYCAALDKANLTIVEEENTAAGENGETSRYVEFSRAVGEPIVLITSVQHHDGGGSYPTSRERRIYINEYDVGKWKRESQHYNRVLDALPYQYESGTLSSTTVSVRIGGIPEESSTISFATREFNGYTLWSDSPSLGIP